jgi:sugar lactone lactonase YvrE
MTEIDCVATTNDVLGECPRWHHGESALYWIDLFKPAIHKLDPATGKTESWTPPEKLGAIAPRVGGGLLLAGRNGLSFFDPPSGRQERLVDPESGGAVNILNDGRCDRRGRFWVGSMNKMIEQPAARLYRYADSHLDAVDEGFWVFNGICWSPDDKRMYVADSHLRTIFVYDFNIGEGVIGGRRVFATMENGQGVPDGASVDCDGCLWSAAFDGGCIIRYTPDGRVDRKIMLPVSRVSACTFGGPDLSILYVTTARFRLPPEKLATETLAGSLLAFDVGVQGLPEPLFAG